MKYVIFENPDTSEFPILFPEHIDHAFIRNSVNSHYPGVKAVRAGFCNSDGGCWGKSIGLNLVSDPKQDEWLLMKAFNR